VLDAPEQLRARYPDAEGYVERDGVKTFWERYGDGDPTVFFLPTWSIVHSRCWKAQLAYFGRHGSAITMDPRGNGRSDRPVGVAPYHEDQFAADALAVLDAAGVERAVLVSLSRGAHRALLLAAEHPERVTAACFVSPALPLVPPPPERAEAMAGFEGRRPSDDGWNKYNRQYWERDFRDFAEFFFGEAFPEAHSTKQIEDCVGWSLDTDPATAISTERARGIATREDIEALCARVHCPALVIHGSADRLISPDGGRTLAAALGAEFVLLDGSGHNPHARIPARLNLRLREFVEAQTPKEP
jgi:pimeloyl-ACP methyl ester carboxylesterase